LTGFGGNRDVLAELSAASNDQSLSAIEEQVMTDQKPQPDPQQSEQKTKEDDTPAHATPQERERLKDFNKDGIPPGQW
jgi:hypothetical protein